MANIKSAKKRILVSQTRAERNKAIRSGVKTAVKKVYAAIEAGDKAAAKEWFDKAIALKSSQIDTLWFLSRYDVEAGDRKGALEKLEEASGGRFSPLNYCSKEQVLEEIARLKGEKEA